MQSLIENFLSFILFQNIEKYRYERLPITNIMSFFFSRRAPMTQLKTTQNIFTFSSSIRLISYGRNNFYWGYPKRKSVGFVTYSICIYCVSITNFNRMFHFNLSVFPEKAFIKDRQHYFNNSLLHYFAGRLTNGFSLFFYS